MRLCLFEGMSNTQYISSDCSFLVAIIVLIFLFITERRTHCGAESRGARILVPTLPYSASLSLETDLPVDSRRDERDELSRWALFSNSNLSVTLVINDLAAGRTHQRFYQKPEVASETRGVLQIQKKRHLFCYICHKMTVVNDQSSNVFTLQEKKKIIIIRKFVS